LPWSTLETSPFVKLLNADTFNLHINSKEWSLVFFHIGSGFDQDAIPSVIAIGASLYPSPIASFNVFEKDLFTDKYDLTRFPVLIAFREGQVLGTFGAKISPENVGNVLEWIETTKVTAHWTEL